MAGAPRQCCNCGGELPAASGGERRGAPDRARYCSNACRQAAYRKRLKAAEAEAQDDPCRSDDAYQAAGRFPIPLDSFVGRRGELDELDGLLSEHCRILTLTGPPGVGKTRLAVELVERIPDRCPDGAWFVDLTTLTDPDLVPQAVAATVGVPEHRGQPLTEACAQVLDRSRALILLDNCERLVEACARLAVELLERCPRLTLLCTSREVLRVPGEVAYPLRGLAAEPAEPDAEPDTDPDAVRLFVQRAVACRPDLELTAPTRQEIAKICTRLDGLPLAIELAARWARTLPTEKILARLSDRFSLLVKGPRTAPPRQRSLCQAIDWSYTTLSTEERAVFRRLAVFAGSFSLEGAAAIGAGDGASAETVLHVVDELQAKSLLTPTACGRFRYLESIRCYAYAQLDTVGEREATNDRLLSWLADLAAPLATDVLVSHELQRTLTVEQDNLQHAVERATGDRDGRWVVLAVALCQCWRRRGHTVQGIRMLERALPRLTAPPAHRALALSVAALLHVSHENHERGSELAAQALEISRALGDTVGTARALRPLAQAKRALGEMREALEYVEERLALIRPLGPPVHVAACLNDVAWNALVQGDLDRAAEALTEALPILRAHGDGDLLPAVLHTDAVLALAHGDLSRATENLLEILGSPDIAAVDVIFGVEGLAMVAAARGHAEQALRLIGATGRLRVERSLPLGSWWGRQLGQSEAAARRQLPSDSAGQALEEGRKLGPGHVVPYALAQHHRAPADGPGTPPLTARERQVAELVAEGCTNRQVSRRLGIAERTVESHLKSIRERLSLDSRTAVAVWVTEQRNQA